MASIFYSLGPCVPQREMLEATKEGDGGTEDKEPRTPPHSKEALLLSIVYIVALHKISLKGKNAQKLI